MYHNSSFVLAFVIAAVLVPSPGAAAAPDFMTRSGCISYALQQPDGTHVYLDAVIVHKIVRDENPPYFIVHDFFAPQSYLIVAVSPPAELRFDETVDLEGTLTTLGNGERALVDATVTAYTDAAFNILYSGPVIKGMDEPTPWLWKGRSGAGNDSRDGHEWYATRQGHDG